ncbi:CRISPR-associated CXXC_CXXC protein Cst1 [Thermocrinis albus DSM 14484]|uniref:CRISPR-associated CXXC_CXXC protein Cst1 n=1 Tax=Thermocrinis albus (strain DSM 14484 / JCM 11386 / HI 11/12) TaxID=638303 RepID=D3SNB6_THEAH|nr:type I-B CRISPR-associated protein Cas8b1/Cst1 [Thermocrinis albus]ADC88653.1 CRISPR-associated CXXC_CXXC protein Cst1 [Thermocrinis albus DSM 14484]
MVVRFYVRDWVSASAAVGLLKALEKLGQEPKEFIDGNSLIFEEKDIIEIFPSAFTKKLIDVSSQKNPKKDSFVDRAYSVLSFLQKNFYSNSPLSNPSSVPKRLEEKSKELEDLYRSDPDKAVFELVKRFVGDTFKKILERETSDHTCFFCGERKASIHNGEPKTFEATNFTPLSASPNTVENLFYNGKNNLYLCSVCEIVFYFAGFGFTKVDKMDNRYIFAYVSDIKETLRLNNTLEYYKGFNKEFVTSFLKDLEHHKSRWILENIYIVEVEKVSKVQSNIYSFSIPPRVAKAMKEYLPKYPKTLEPVFNEFLKYIYFGRSLYQLLFEILYGYFHEEELPDSKDSKKITDALRLGMRLAKGNKGLYPSLLFLSKFQEVVEMKDKSFVEKQVGWAYREGLQLKNALLKELGDKALDRIRSISYSILEAIRRRDIDAFQQNLIRAYLSVEREIPRVFVDALKDESFSRIAYAFLIGLNGTERREEDGGEAEETMG